MLDAFVSILDALWHQDFMALQNLDSVIMIYFCVAFLVWLESALLPAAPLPCDSIVILSGTLGALGVIDFKVVVALLIFASAIGSWFAYLQGRWLEHLPKVRRWVDRVPSNKIQVVDRLLIQHGVIALFVARFIPLVRPLLPLMMGFRIKKHSHFLRVAGLSAIAWVCLLTGVGYLLTLLPERISRVVTIMLMVAPFVTLAVAIFSFVVNWLFKRNKKVPVIPVTKSQGY